MKKHIPNFITLLNLTSGILAVLAASQGYLEMAAYFVFLGIIFDFFDGFLARILDAKSELGLQLDSLADMVTSGVAPGIIMIQLLIQSISDKDLGYYLSHSKELGFLPLTGILITLGAAYRLAKFNIDTRQTTSFIGLPTPAMSIFVVSLPLIYQYSGQEWTMHLVTNTYFLLVTSVLGCLLMNANIPLFSLKFKDASLKNNRIKYIFLIVSFVLLLGLRSTAIPLIILWYILLSIANNLTKKIN